MGATADGASVNTGCHKGVLTQLGEERPWLLKIHCVNHRIELAVKDATNIKYFKKAEKFYRNNYYLLRNSGTLKTALKQACEALDITYYNLPKCHGTRFVNHRKRGFTRLCHMWPAFVTTYENAVLTTSSSKTRAKISGLLKKFRDVRELLRVESFLDVLELVSTASLVFESKELLPCDIKTTLKKTLAKIDSELRENTESKLDFFSIKEIEKGKCTIERDYCRAGHERRKLNNQEFTNVVVDDLTYSKNCVSIAKSNKLKVAKQLKTLLSERFASFEEPIFQSMKFYDPKYWDDDDLVYGEDQITCLYKHFEKPLVNQEFDLEKCLKEWKSFKILVRESYDKFLAKNLWKMVLKSRHEEYPQLALLAKLLFAISGSNSTVERAFSTLSLILTDRRISLRHESLENIMLIHGNDCNWSAKEKDEIISRAREIYTEKRRRTRLEGEPMIKKRKTTKKTDNNQMTESASSDEESESDGENYSAFETSSGGESSTGESCSDLCSDTDNED